MLNLAGVPMFLVAAGAVPFLLWVPVVTGMTMDTNNA